MTFYDATNPRRPRLHLVQGQGGLLQVRHPTWWLDACEPELVPEQPANLRYHAGPGAEVSGLYPRCTPAGSTRGCRPRGRRRSSACAGPPGRAASATAPWCGPATSTRLRHLRRQIPAGLNIGLSGIPWWTTDIGGFKDGDITVAVVPRAHRALVPVRRVLPGLPAARDPPARDPDRARSRPARPTRSGRSARKRTASSGSSCSCANGCAPTSWSRCGPPTRPGCPRCARCSWTSPRTRTAGPWTISSCSAATSWSPRC